MARSARLSSAVTVLGLLSFAIPATTADHRDIVAHDLKELRAPGKVEAALWTRRSEGYTFQVVLRVAFGQPPVGSRITRVSNEGLSIPGIQVWLLKADGSLLRPERTRLPDARVINVRSMTAEASFQFPEVAGTEAVAVAMKIDEEFHIQRLEPFGD